ncbi:Ubiquitin carboxyl-terminal hydrolase 48 [Acropora cervicornis]|uniref:Ubiquitin carboxyl-terminal hydrolase 48 n=1 Tax=Acropora cervicornis TaxID=6130 RepID=A0AAD9Q8I2_ACRCE|nr:Ubiquitin carboxyl-terminal hydrolase 48 [Acropora cervicornis]
MDEEFEVPPHIQELVATDNSRFEDWVRQDALVSKGKAKQAEIRKLYEEMPVSPETEKYEWLSTKWLRNWMDDKLDTPPNRWPNYFITRLNCFKLYDLLMYLRLKRFLIDMASVLWGAHVHERREIFETKTSVPPSLWCANTYEISRMTDSSRYLAVVTLRQTFDSLCINCVRERCRRIRFESRLTDDCKFVSDALRNQSTDSVKFFWVGRRSLLRWKALAVHHEGLRQSLIDGCQNTSNHDTEEEDETKATGSESNYDVHPTGNEKGSPEQTRAENESDEGSEVFNEDFLCEHGGLSTDASCRRLVPENIWQRLKYYFPSAPELTSAHPLCKLCQEEDEEERQKTELYRLLASEQKTAFNQLYSDRNRPQHPKTNVPPESIRNEPLLCPHKKFLFNPECDVEDNGANEELCYIWQHEWNGLTQTYPYDNVITVTKNVTQDGLGELVTTPERCEFALARRRFKFHFVLYVLTVRLDISEVCLECSMARVQARAKHVENYSCGTIFVRKITKDHTDRDIEQVVNDSFASKEGDYVDPDFQSPPHSKKQKLDGDSRRRSSRHRKQRGEVSLTVGSTETLRDVKLQIDEPQGTISQDALPVSNAPEEGFKDCVTLEEIKEEFSDKKRLKDAKVTTAPRHLCAQFK